MRFLGVVSTYYILYTVLQSLVCIIVFTINRLLYPRTSVHSVSVLIPHPREMRILWSWWWSQTVNKVEHQKQAHK